MALTVKEIAELYRKRAKNYDLTANLYYLIGFREYKYRKKAVEVLHLRSGDTVVEIGCGTGLNFSLLRHAVGDGGRIIGIDLTDSMIMQAEKRINENGWTNIELMRCDASTYSFPENVDGIISTFAITLIPEYDSVIKNGAEALETHKRFVILDFKRPDNMPMFLIRFGVWITKPFGVSLDIAERHPWESIKKYMNNVSMTGLYMGFVYIASGEKGQNR